MTSLVTQRRQMALICSPFSSRNVSPSKARSRTSHTVQSTPRLREELGEDVELVDHAVFEIIADGNAGMSDLEAISVVDRKELLDPGLEQVAAGQAVRFGELEEGGGSFSPSW